MISDAALLEAVQQGVTVAQLVAIIIADRDAARAKRAARSAGKLASVGQVESELRVSVGLDPHKPDTSMVASRPVTVEGLARPDVKLAVARKAVPFLKLYRSVSVNGAEVLAALLDFCHSETLRCYPGYEHIALKLGRSGQKDPGRHIRRGVSDLVACGLLRVAKHAGLNHSNAYFPQWEKLAEVVAEVESGVRVQSDNGDRIVLQYQKKKLPSVGRRVQRATEPDRAQRQLPLVSVVDGGRGAVVAPSVPQGLPKEQAGLRVMQAISAHLRGKPLRFAQRVRADIGAELLDAAITAEVRAKGSGIGVILDGLGPGPPGEVPAVSETLMRQLGERRG